MDFWYELFTALDTKESYLVLFWMISAAILGFLIGFFIRGRAIRKWKKRYKQKESEWIALQSENSGLKEKLELQEADLKKAVLEAEEEKSKVRLLEQQQVQLQNEAAVFKDQYEALKNQYSNLQTENQSQLARIEELNLKLAGLEDSGQEPEEPAANATVLAELASLREEQAASKELLSKLAERLTFLEEENANLKDDFTGIRAASGQIKQEESQSETKKRMDADAFTLAIIEEKITSLEEENTNLKEELAHIQGIGSRSVAPIERKIVPPSTVEKEKVESEPENILISTDDHSVHAKSAIRAAIGKKIVVAAPSQKEDLKKITGIGPFIEQKLNELGIYTYEQISQLDTELIRTLTDAIQFFPGRIERDDWVGQAAALFQLKKSNPEALMKPERPSDPNDLKIVEGIGPKIEQLLKDAGISTWKDLAEAEVPRLREILEAAGNAYKIHNPTTWPDQAKLAFLEEWEKLEEFQSYLNGGRDMNTKG